MRKHLHVGSWLLVALVACSAEDPSNAAAPGAGGDANEPDTKEPAAANEHAGDGGGTPATTDGGDDGGRPVGSKRLFLTGEVYDGNLGGHAGADAICQKEADGAKLGGTWRAYLRATETAAAHIAAVGPWFLLDETLAFEGSALPTPKVKLNLTPLGKRPEGNGVVTKVGVRTGASLNGGFAVQDGKQWTCNGFTIDSASSPARGEWGNALSTEFWNDVVSAVDDPSANSAVEMRLYCFEQ